MVPVPEPAYHQRVNEASQINERLTQPQGDLDVVAHQRADHLSRRHPDPVSDQHVAARWAREADLPDHRDRAWRAVAAADHRAVLRPIRHVIAVF